MHLARVVAKPKDFKSLVPYFLCADEKVIKDTYEVTTQNARSGWISGEITQTSKSPFPALNVSRRNEPVATDTIYSDVPSVPGGYTSAQIFIGCDSAYASAFGMKSDKEFVNTLWDEIRKRGAMDKLVSDRAQVEISNKVKEVLRYLVIDDWQSEPHYQHQNPAERRYRHLKKNTNKVLNRTGAPASMWLLCLLYVCFIMNRLAVASIGGRTPAEKVYGETPDISMIPRFQFWEPVYFSRNDMGDGKNFPSKSDEAKGRFVGFSEDVGHKMTYKILTDDTYTVLYRSRIRTALDEDNKNYRLEEDDKFQANPQDADIVKSKHEDKPMKVIDFDEMIGRTFLMPAEEDGTRLRAKIIEQIEDEEKNIASDPTMVKFRCSVNDGQYEEIMTYNQILDKLEDDLETEGTWKFKSIDGHQGPLSTSDPGYKGSRWNVRVNWESGETTYEPLSLMAKDDPVTCAIYAKDNNLLHLDGWKRFKKLANRQKKLLRMANQAKLRSYKMSKKYKFGVEVPRDHNHAMQLDQQNGNHLWKEAEEKELSQIDEYETFNDLGKGDLSPSGHKKIRAHMVYDVKHDGRRKARLVADGHLTDVPTDSTYSSVVSLRGLRMVIFLAELNDLQIWGTDIGNAHLEAHTKEKLCVVGGGECPFGQAQWLDRSAVTRPFVDGAAISNHPHVLLPQFIAVLHGISIELIHTNGIRIGLLHCDEDEPLSRQAS